jgi:predicted nucleotidyltransferase
MGMYSANILTPYEQIATFCLRWNITEFALFGSVLRDDFQPGSDIDVLVSFAPDTHWTLFDQVTMQDELQRLFGRHVDLVSKRGIERSRNTRRRNVILRSAEVIYARS